MSETKMELNVNEMNEISGGALHEYMMDFAEAEYYQELYYCVHSQDEEEREQGTRAMRDFTQRMIAKYGPSVQY